MTCKEITLEKKLNKLKELKNKAFPTKNHFIADFTIIENPIKDYLLKPKSLYICII